MYAGLRPLLSGESESTSKLSREHVVAHAAPRAGRGRRRQVHDVPGDGQGRGRRGRARRWTSRCRSRVTDRTCRWSAPTAIAAAWNRAAADRGASPGCTWPRIEHLLGRYGTLIDELLELIAADPSLGEPLAGAEDYLRVEVVYAASHEGARHLDDVLARRTRISIETWDRGVRGGAGGGAT